MFIFSKTSIILALLIVFSPLSNADDYQYLAQKLDASSSLSGEFTQVMTDDAGDKIEETKGEFKLLRPGYFMWKTQPPSEQLIVSNKKTLSVFDPDLDQVTVYKAQEMSNTPAGILTSDSALIKEFFIVTKLTEQDKKNETFRLTYRDASKEDFNSIDISFQDSLLHALSVQDKLNQTTRIIFTSLDSTSPIATDVFDFTPPEGVDVIVN